MCKLDLSYLQLKFTKVGTKCVNDSGKQLHFYRTRTLFRKGTYGRTIVNGYGDKHFVLKKMIGAMGDHSISCI